jgi:hypothetical protein
VLIELGRLAEARTVYRRSLELDQESGEAESELGYIEHLIKKQGERVQTPPWFLNCLRFPPQDPLTRGLVAAVDGLEPIPGPKTMGAEAYERISSAFLNRGWVGFEEAFNQIVPCGQDDYAKVKLRLLREPIFMRTVHERMARIYLGKATINEVLEEIERSNAPAKGSPGSARCQ